MSDSVLDIVTVTEWDDSSYVVYGLGYFAISFDNSHFVADNSVKVTIKTIHKDGSSSTLAPIFLYEPGELRRSGNDIFYEDLDSNLIFTIENFFTGGVFSVEQDTFLFTGSTSIHSFVIKDFGELDIYNEKDFNNIFVLGDYSYFLNNITFPLDEVPPETPPSSPTDFTSLSLIRYDKFDNKLHIFKIGEEFFYNLFSLGLVGKNFYDNAYFVYGSGSQAIFVIQSPVSDTIPFGKGYFFVFFITGSAIFFLDIFYKYNIDNERFGRKDVNLIFKDGSIVDGSTGIILSNVGQLLKNIIWIEDERHILSDGNSLDIHNKVKSINGYLRMKDDTNDIYVPYSTERGNYEYYFFNNSIRVATYFRDGVN